MSNILEKTAKIGVAVPIKVYEGITCDGIIRSPSATARGCRKKGSDRITHVERREHI